MVCVLLYLLFVISGCRCFGKPLDDLQDIQDQDFRQLGEQGR
jgi:hypothetical protein